MALNRECGDGLRTRRTRSSYLALPTTKTSKFEAYKLWGRKAELFCIETSRRRPIPVTKAAIVWSTGVDNDGSGDELLEKSLAIMRLSDMFHRNAMHMTSLRELFIDTRF